jgi:folylpolyglutamate synthase/dihydropteroate synthase
VNLNFGELSSVLNLALGGRKLDPLKPLRRTTGVILTKLIAVTGTNGKTTTAKLTAHMCCNAGLRTGVAVTEGVYVNGIEFFSRDVDLANSRFQAIADAEERTRSNLHGSEMRADLLIDVPDVDVAVIEYARGALIRNFDRIPQLHAAALLNVGNDHIGECGVASVEDMAKLKSTLLKKVIDIDGWAIINWDDPLLRNRALDLAATIIPFSLTRESTQQFRIAAYRMNDALWFRDPMGEIQLACLAEVPCCFGGNAEFMVQNCLAACLLAIKMGVSIEVVRRSLREFDIATNVPGRLHFIKNKDSMHLFDYAHNIDALKALSLILGNRPRQAVVSPSRFAGQVVPAVSSLILKLFDRVVVSIELPSDMEMVVQMQKTYDKVTVVRSEFGAVSLAAWDADSYQLTAYFVRDISRAQHILNSISKAKSAATY